MELLQPKSYKMGVEKMTLTLSWSFYKPRVVVQGSVSYNSGKRF